MLLAYVPGFGQNGEQLELCLVADKADVLTRPILVGNLFPNPAGVIRVGPEEAAVINVDSQDGGMVISAMNPSAIYLTPNLPQTPGFKTRKVKVVIENEQHRTFYEKSGGWEEWIANKERA